MNTLGARIKELRLSKNLSQQELADILGMKRENVSNYERGVITKIPSDVLETLSNYFEVSADYLLGRDIPDWASEKDIIDLKTYLETDAAMSYDGEFLTLEEKQRVNDILTGLFFEMRKAKLDDREKEKKNGK